MAGYNRRWNPPFTAGYGPKLPESNSENMRRVQGREPSNSPLTSEQGDVWPGLLAPSPTLQDLKG
jgi:hypothetical protein